MQFGGSPYLPRKEKKRRGEGTGESLHVKIFIKQCFCCPAGKRLPCGPVKGSSLLSIVNADFNNRVKAEEVMAEILAKDDSSRFQVAQSSLRD